MKTETKQRLELLLNEIMMVVCLLITGSTLTNQEYLIAGVCGIAGIYFYGITTLTATKYNYKPFYYNWLPKKTREYYTNKTIEITEIKDNQEYKIIEE